MSTCQKNSAHDFIALNEPDRLFALSRAIAQDNETPNRLGFTTPGFLGPDLGLALVLTPTLLRLTEEMFKQFM